MKAYHGTSDEGKLGKLRKIKTRGRRNHTEKNLVDFFTSFVEPGAVHSKITIHMVRIITSAVSLLSRLPPNTLSSFFFFSSLSLLPPFATLLDLAPD